MQVELQELGQHEERAEEPEHDHAQREHGHRELPVAEEAEPEHGLRREALPHREADQDGHARDAGADHRARRPAVHRRVDDRPERQAEPRDREALGRYLIDDFGRAALRQIGNVYVARPGVTARGAARGRPAGDFEQLEAHAGRPIGDLH